MEETGQRYKFDGTKWSEAGGASSWNDLTDKPFGEVAGGDTLTWDGGGEGLEYVEAIGAYKVSDASVSAEYIGAVDEYSTTAVCTISGISLPLVVIAANGPALVAQPAGVGGLYLYFIAEDIPNDGETLSAGVYCTPFDGAAFSLTITGYTGFSSTKKVDPKYLYQPDWNQNDETQPDYVKNRPFYTGEQVMLAEQTFTPVEGGVQIATTTFPDIGSEVKIYFDGEVYACVVENAFGYPAAGNLDGFMGTWDDGAPVCLLWDPGGGVVQIVTADLTTDHTINVTGDLVVKIPAKYYDGYAIFYIDSVEDGGYIYKDFAQTTKLTADELNAAVGKGPVVLQHFDISLAKSYGYYTPSFISGYHADGYRYATINNEGTLVKRYTAEYTAS